MKLNIQNIILILLSVILIFVFMFQIKAHQEVVKMSNSAVGIASWYDKGIYKDGESFSGNFLTCASVHFPRYSLLLVENIANRKKVLVWNNDIHEATDIICDLSITAFKKIANPNHGIINVRITKLCDEIINPNPQLFGRKRTWSKIKRTVEIKKRQVVK